MKLDQFLHNDNNWIFLVSLPQYLVIVGMSVLYMVLYSCTMYKDSWLRGAVCECTICTPAQCTRIAHCVGAVCERSSASISTTPTITRSPGFCWCCYTVPPSPPLQRGQWEHIYRAPPTLSILHLLRIYTSTSPKIVVLYLI